MLTHRAAAISRFTRSDATRLGIASGILILAMTAILAADLLPQETLQVQAGDLAPRDILAPRAVEFESEVQTAEARAAARAAVEPQYDFTSDKAIAIAAEQAAGVRASGGPRRCGLRDRTARRPVVSCSSRARSPTSTRRRRRRSKGSCPGDGRRSATKPLASWTRRSGSSFATPMSPRPARGSRVAWPAISPRPSGCWRPRSSARSSCRTRRSASRAPRPLAMSPRRTSPLSSWRSCRTRSSWEMACA